MVPNLTPPRFVNTRQHFPSSDFYQVSGTFNLQYLFPYLVPTIGAAVLNTSTLNKVTFFTFESGQVILA